MDKIRFDDDTTWLVGSFVFPYHTGIFVPVNQIPDEMSDGEIGRRLRELASKAELSSVREFAEYLMGHEVYEESVDDDLDRLQPFADQDPYVKEVVTHLLERKRFFDRMKKARALAELGPVVYLLKANGVYKIGRTVDLVRRMRSFENLPFDDLELICAIPSDDIAALERQLHQRYGFKRTKGEWFSLTQEDVAEIEAMAENGKSAGDEDEHTGHRQTTPNKVD